MDVKEIRRLNLEALAAATGGTTALASKLGKSPSQISQWLGGYRSMTEESAREVETSLRKPFRWMDALHLAEPQPLYKETPPEVSGLAQDLSHPFERVAETLEWEDLMRTEKLPRQFYVVLADDAMAPSAPRGTKVKFDSQRAAFPGDAILARTADGKLHFRELRVRADGALYAFASNASYPALQMVPGEVEIAAVFVGVEARWSSLLLNR